MADELDVDLVLDEIFNPTGGAMSPEAPAATSEVHLDSRIWVWDLETGPQTADKLMRFYVPPDGPPESFNPETVKIGNLKDQAKIDAKIEKARADWQKARDSYQQLADEHWAEYVEMAALSAITGRICTSAYLFADRGDATFVHEAGTKGEDGEREVLEGFWARVEHTRQAGGRIVGYNLAGFDLPYAVQRSYLIGVNVPRGLFWKNRYPIDTFVDLYAIWKCGTYGNQGVSQKLDNVLAACGLAQKNGDGKDFWGLYKSTKTRAKAIDYARNDVVVEAALARRMGAIQ